MMKLIFGLIFTVLIFFPIAEKEIDDKTAILMVHFGSTYDETRAKTIDLLNAKVEETFPNALVVDAFTSRIVIKRLKERGINKSTPQEVLLRLAADGYENVIIQGSFILDGIEYQVLQQEADIMKQFFKEIKVGKPLLYSIEDCEKVVSILAERYRALINQKDELIFVGHGTSTPANATYSQIDYMFGAEGFKNIHVATIEGYPTFEDVLIKLKEKKNKKVTLVPFMFVAGDHAVNDIANEWRNNLEKMGYEVSVVLEGLGEVPQIQERYVEHIKKAMASDFTDARSHKQKFIEENL